MPSPSPSPPPISRELRSHLGSITVPGGPPLSTAELRLVSPGSGLSRKVMPGCGGFGSRQACAFERMRGPPGDQQASENWQVLLRRQPTNDHAPAVAARRRPCCANPPHTCLCSWGGGCSGPPLPAAQGGGRAYAIRIQSGRSERGGLTHLLPNQSASCCRRPCHFIHPLARLHAASRQFIAQCKNRPPGGPHAQTLKKKHSNAHTHLQAGLHSAEVKACGVWTLALGDVMSAQQPLGQVLAVAGHAEVGRDAHWDACIGIPVHAQGRWGSGA